MSRIYYWDYTHKKLYMLCGSCLYKWNFMFKQWENTWDDYSNTLEEVTEDKANELLNNYYMLKELRK